MKRAPPASIASRMVKKLNCRKGGELSIPGVASPGGAGYDFLRQSIANRLARRTNGLGAHPGLRHWASGPGAAGADRISGRGKSHPVLSENSIRFGIRLVRQNHR